MSDSMSISALESQSTTAAAASTMAVIISSSNEVELVKCDCCGIKEECTQSYIDRIRDTYQGRWICGLCSEAVQEEIIRSERLITTEEAMNRHMNFRNKFRCPPTTTKADLIVAIRELFRRSLDSPRVLRSTPTSPRSHQDSEIRRSSLSRSESCFPTLAG